MWRHYDVRVDPAAGKGPKLSTDHGGPGDRAPLRGLQGSSAPLRREILHFWAQFARFGAYLLPTLHWKSLDIFPIKMLFFFNYDRIKLAIYPAHANPSSSPSYSRLHIILSLQAFCCPNLLSFSFFFFFFFLI